MTRFAAFLNGFGRPTRKVNSSKKIIKTICLVLHEQIVNYLMFKARTLWREKHNAGTENTSLVDTYNQCKKNQT